MKNSTACFKYDFTTVLQRQTTFADSKVLSWYLKVSELFPLDIYPFLFLFQRVLKYRLSSALHWKSRDKVRLEILKK